MKFSGYLGEEAQIDQPWYADAFKWLTETQTGETITREVLVPYIQKQTGLLPSTTDVTAQPVSYTYPVTAETEEKPVILQYLPYIAGAVIGLPLIITLLGRR